MCGWCERVLCRIDLDLQRLSDNNAHLQIALTRSVVDVVFEEGQELRPRQKPEATNVRAFAHHNMQTRTMQTHNTATQCRHTEMRKRITEAIAIGALPACQGQAIRVVEPASGCEWGRM